MKNIIAKIIKFIKSYASAAFMALCMALIGVIGYNLGQISILRKTPLKITAGADIYTATAVSSDKPAENNNSSYKQDLRVVASKNSNKYHYTWCSGAQRIKPENQIWFDNEKAAMAAGYTLAGNCNN